jgi:hypothetical protein
LHIENKVLGVVPVLTSNSGPPRNLKTASPLLKATNPPALLQLATGTAAGSFHGDVGLSSQSNYVLNGRDLIRAEKEMDKHPDQLERFEHRGLMHHDGGGLAVRETAHQ